MMVYDQYLKKNVKKLEKRLEEQGRRQSPA
jgi:hypothetical protein